MPDEERVRTKRRKLDSIISKLHQTTPLEASSSGQEETLEHDMQSASPKNIEDPKQKKREKKWRTDRSEAKKRKADRPTPSQLSTLPEPTVPTNKDTVPELRKQLAAKTKECSRLKIKLNSTKKALKSQLQIVQMLEKIQACVSGLEDKVAAGFLNLKDRLAVLENQPVNPLNSLSATINSGCVEKTDNEISEETKGEPMTTINVEAFRTLQKGDSHEPTASPKEREGEPMTTINVEAFRTLQKGNSHEATASPVCNPAPTCAVQKVSEELIATYVTPTKIKRVQLVLEKQCERHLCALKLLPCFFTKEELASSNTDGSHDKQRLDKDKLNSLKLLLFSKFPVSSIKDKDVEWRKIKGKINSKCRAVKHVHVRM